MTPISFSVPGPPTAEVDCYECDGRGYETRSAHAEGCWGDCSKHGCPVPVQEPCDICGGNGVLELPILELPTETDADG